MVAAFLAYAGRTPGLEAGDNATVILGDEDEVQPDLFLRILPRHGGQSRNIVERSKASKQHGAQYIQLLFACTRIEFTGLTWEIRGIEVWIRSDIPVGGVSRIVDRLRCTVGARLRKADGCYRSGHANR